MGVEGNNKATSRKCWTGKSWRQQLWAYGLTRHSDYYTWTRNNLFLCYSSLRLGRTKFTYIIHPIKQIDYGRSHFFAKRTPFTNSDHHQGEKSVSVHAQWSSVIDSNIEQVWKDVRVFNGCVARQCDICFACKNSLFSDFEQNSGNPATFCIKAWKWKRGRQSSWCVSTSHWFWYARLLA